MQKTFNVFVKRISDDEFKVCSKRILAHDRLSTIDKNSETIDIAATVAGCDVSQWLETLGLKEDEVIEGQITFKFKNK